MPYQVADIETAKDFSINYNGLEMDLDALSAIDPENIKEAISYNMEKSQSMTMRSIASFAGAAFIGLASFGVYAAEHLGPNQAPNTDAGNLAKDNARTKAVMLLIAAGACIVGGVRARNKGVAHVKQANDLDEALVMVTEDFKEARFDATVPNLKAKGFITETNHFAFYPRSTEIAGLHL